MYRLMGIVALALTAKRPALAWQLHRHGDRALPAPYRVAVLIGLTLTFVLGAGAGIALSQLQPPAGVGLPVFGWSMTGGDLRVAHFVGIHTARAMPVVGALTVALRLPAARSCVVVAAIAWITLFAALAAQALLGHPFIAAQSVDS